MYIYNLIPILAFVGKVKLFSEKTTLVTQVAAPIILSIIILVLYISAYLGISFYITLVLYGIGFWGIYNSYKKKESLNILSQDYILSIVSIGFIVVIGLYYRECHLVSREDIRYWGLFSKELLARGYLEYLSSNTSILSEYAFFPRASSMFHYYYLLPTGYNEGGALCAHFLIAICFLMPFFASNSSENVFNSAIFTLIGLSVCALSTNFLRSLHNEAITGLAGVSIILIYFHVSKNKNFILQLAPLIVVTPLFAGNIFFSFFCVLCVFVMHHKATGLDIFKFKPKNARFYLGLAAPFASYYLFLLPYYLVNLEGSGGNSKLSAFSLYSLFDIIIFIKTLVLVLFKEAVLISILLIYLAYKCTKKQDDKSYELFNHLVIATIIAYILLALTLLISYFGNYQTIGVGIVLKYFAPYIILSVVLSLYFMGIAPLEKKDQLIIYFLMVFSAGAFLNNLDLVASFVSLEEENSKKQIKAISNLLISNKDQVSFSYENKANNEECYDFAYKISPMINNSEVRKCLAENIDFHNLYIGRYDSIPSKLNTNCKIIYKPFSLKYVLVCE
ncbi:MAG: hypothetical protein SFT68_02900 [Rickettsiaceae bacterium]|nr:hypothetical protein [Rickettsiaceae bacterium]